MGLQGQISGRGKIERLRPPAPTNVHRLRIDRVPSTGKVSFHFVTSKSEFEEHESEFLSHFVDGQFQFEYRGATTPRRFFAPLDCDRENRTISVIEVRGDYGNWIPIGLSTFS